MIGGDVKPQRRKKLPLTAAAVHILRGRAGLACLLLMAACSAEGGERPVVLPPLPTTTGGAQPIVAGAASGPASGTAGFSGTAPMPGTAGVGVPTGGPPRPPVGAAGTGAMPGTSGTGAVVPPPTAGTGSVEGDAGLPPFDGGSEPGRNQVQAGQLCDRMTTLQCAAEQHCCTTVNRTFATCKEKLMKVCEDNDLDGVARNMVSGFSPTHTAAAFEKMEQLSAACDPAGIAWAVQVDGLRGIMQGTVAPGGTCKPMGLPSNANYGGALASCTQIATHACLFTGDGPLAAPTSATCAPRGAAGATCFMGVNCQDGLYCANPMKKYSSGKCTVPAAVGATCTADDECASLMCRGAVCVVPTSQNTYCSPQ